MNIQDLVSVYGPKTPLVFFSGGWDFSDWGERLMNLVPDLVVLYPH